MTTIVFNLRERPVRFSADGNRVPGRTRTEIADVKDEFYLAALERGDLVVLSETAAAPPPPVEVQTVTVLPEPEPPATDESADTAVEGEDATVTEPRKKQPNKAKEN